MIRFFYMEDDVAFSPSGLLPMQVLAEETGPAETGLLDARGNKLFRASDRTPLGFDLSGIK